MDLCRFYERSLEVELLQPGIDLHQNRWFNNVQDGENKPSVIRLYPRHREGDVGWKLKCAQTNSIIVPAKANTCKLIRVIVPVFIWEGNK